MPPVNPPERPSRPATDALEANSARSNQPQHARQEACWRLSTRSPTHVPWAAIPCDALELAAEYAQPVVLVAIEMWGPSVSQCRAGGQAWGWFELAVTGGSELAV